MDYINATDSELEQLVQQKDINAICELGERYLYGKNGHEKQYSLAYKMFHKGEKQGDKRAYKGLGDIYHNGWYMIKNEELAKEYYQKAGISVVPKDNLPQPQPQLQPQPQPQPQPSNGGGTSNRTSAVNTDTQLQGLLNTAKQQHNASDYTGASQSCMQILQEVQRLRNSSMSYQGNDPIDKYEIDAYWLLAFIGYNTQNHQQFQDYIVRDGVLALHPWGAYLQYVMHMMDNAAGSVLQSDFNTLLFISNNQNLTMSERGDVFAAIADLISKGHGKKEGYKPNQAVDFLQEAANCGNEFAKEQLGYE